MKWVKRSVLYFAIGCVLSAVYMFVILRPTISIEEEFAYRAKQDKQLQYAFLLDSIAKEEVLNVGLTSYTYQELKEKQWSWGWAEPAMQVTDWEVQLLPLLRQLISNSNQRLLNNMKIDKEQGSISSFLQKIEQQLIQKHPNINLKKAFISNKKLKGIYENTPASAVREILEKEIIRQIQDYQPTLEERLRNLGWQTFDVELLPSQFQFRIQFPTLYNPEKLNNALTTIGELRFEELYTMEEMFGYDNSGSMLQLNDSLKRVQGDTAETSLGPIFELIKPLYTEGNDPFLAHVEKEYKDSVLHLLNSAEAQHFLPTGISFHYSNKPEELEDGRLVWSLYAIKPSRFELTQQHVEESFPTSNPSGFGYAVSISLDRKGARIWSKMTEANINKSIAVIVDGKVYSAPRVHERIPNGNTSISGNFSVKEATDLANLFAGSTDYTMHLSLLGQQAIAEARYAGWGYLLASGALVGLIIGAFLMGFFVGGRHLWRMVLAGYRGDD